MNFIVDFHGFTRFGAAQCIIRTFESIDPKRYNKIKFNVGVGDHSQNEPVLTQLLQDLSSENLPINDFKKPAGVKK